MTWDLNDRAETTDGSRPEAAHLSQSQTQDVPLSAFTVLRGGDVFERSGRARRPDLNAEVRQYIASNITLVEHDEAGRQCRESVEQEIVHLLGGNVQLLKRMLRAKPLRIDLVPQGVALASLGFPRVMSRTASGIFWDQPKWERARIALRQDRLPLDAALVVHEMAHAVHYLAFDAEERSAIYDLLRPSFGSKAHMDEVFAIYSEREFVEQFGEREKRAPGVYGHTRRQWSENHVFTRFIRKLYFPYVPAAGPGMGGGF